VHHVTQFHYVGWPDHGIPNDFDVILEMMAEMREIKQKDPTKAPMVIHCRWESTSGKLEGGNTAGGNQHQANLRVGTLQVGNNIRQT